MNLIWQLLESIGNIPLCSVWDISYVGYLSAPQAASIYSCFMQNQFASCSSVMHLKRSFKLWNKSLEDSQAVLGGKQTSKALFVKFCVLNPGIH